MIKKVSYIKVLLIGFCFFSVATLIAPFGKQRQACELSMRRRCDALDAGLVIQNLIENISKIVKARINVNANYMTLYLDDLNLITTETVLEMERIFFQELPYFANKDEGIVLEQLNTLLIVLETFALFEEVNKWSIYKGGALNTFYPIISKELKDFQPIFLEKIDLYLSLLNKKYRDGILSDSESLRLGAVFNRIVRWKEVVLDGIAGFKKSDCPKIFFLNINGRVNKRWLESYRGKTEINRKKLEINKTRIEDMHKVGKRLALVSEKLKLICASELT